MKITNNSKMQQTLINIRNLNREELQHHIVALGEPAFRAKQVYEWIWKKNAHSFEEMNNIGKSLQEKLGAAFYFDGLTVEDQQVSTDKTIKCAFGVDGQSQVIEGVLIPTTNRMTACISSQVGCSLSCAFCATGRLKMMRNLSAGEIVDQALYLKKSCRYKIQHSPLKHCVYGG